MATRSVATTDSLNTLRTTVNAISGTDIGDLATLGTSAKSSIVAAVNEINTSVTGTGFNIKIKNGTTFLDKQFTFQAVGYGKGV